MAKITARRVGLAADAWAETADGRVGVRRGFDGSTSIERFRPDGKYESVVIDLALLKDLIAAVEGVK